MQSIFNLRCTFKKQYLEVIKNAMARNFFSPKFKWGSLLQAFTTEQVVCRQLGFLNGQQVRRPRDTPENEPVSPVWVEGFSCDGTEAVISDCHRTPFGAITRCSTGTMLGGFGADNVRIRCTNEGVVMPVLIFSHVVKKNCQSRGLVCCRPQHVLLKVYQLVADQHKIM